jgi:hypothetical protein
MIFKHLDIRFTFFCRSTRVSKLGTTPIGNRKDIFTGLRCINTQWDATSQRVKGKDKSAIATNGNLD